MAIGILGFTTATQAEELLIQFKNQKFAQKSIQAFQEGEFLGEGWVRVKVESEKSARMILNDDPAIRYIQKNYKMKPMLHVPKFGPLQLPSFTKAAPGEDNPAIPSTGSGGQGADPQFSSQWGLQDIGATAAWRRLGKGSEEVIVAVIDTGVDYTHEDLVDNLWRNTKEIPNNGIDDDGNGYIDDLVGWDFVSNDNKPYDKYTAPIQLLLGGGNPGHGTHCAGNVAARGDNGKGIAGVAPNVKIMSLRFISDEGSGTTADAIKAIRYAVDNGARILSNSWGSIGEDPNDPDGNKALKDAIQYALDNDVLFVAAAGNGKQGVGYDNDTDSQPAYPASYDHENILSVAALDENDQLGSFSNWGLRSVDIGAPGVKVFSTVPSSDLYTDTVIDMLGLNITWDGTSMATPHVAGAAALYLSNHPNASFRDMKEAILRSAVKIPALQGKAVSEGKLNLQNL